jgi:hypothetical protein
VLDRYSELDPESIGRCRCQLEGMVDRFYSPGSEIALALKGLARRIDEQVISRESVLKHLEFEEMFFVPLCDPWTGERIRSDHRLIRDQIARLGSPVPTFYLRHGLWEEEHLRPLSVYEITER